MNKIKILITVILLLNIYSVSNSSYLNNSIINGKSYISHHIQILPVGDSITLGDNPETTYYIGGYRIFLQELLSSEFVFTGPYFFPTSEYYTTRYSVRHASIGGERTDEIEFRILDNLNTISDSAQGVILLHAGTNDIGQSYSLTDAVDNMEDIIDIIVQYNSNIKIYVALILPIDDITFDARVNTYNGLLDTMLQTKQSSNSNIIIVDINQKFVDYGDWASDLLEDGVHPNDTGYERMANQWYSCIQDSTNAYCNGNTGTTNYLLNPDGNNLLNPDGQQLIAGDGLS